MTAVFPGYRRPNGRVATRNHVVVVPATSHANRICELVQERRSLTELRALQETPLREATNQRHRFEALSGGVSDLAAEGDPAAKLIVDGLRRQGLVLPAREIDPSFVITHTAKLEDGPEMYKVFRDKRDSCIKVVLKP